MTFSQINNVLNMFWYNYLQLQIIILLLYCLRLILLEIRLVKLKKINSHTTFTLNGPQKEFFLFEMRKHSIEKHKGLNTAIGG